MCYTLFRGTCIIIIVFSRFCFSVFGKSVPAVSPDIDLGIIVLSFRESMSDCKHDANRELACIRKIECRDRFRHDTITIESTFAHTGNHETANRFRTRRW